METLDFEFDYKEEVLPELEADLVEVLKTRLPETQPFSLCVVKKVSKPRKYTEEEVAEFKALISEQFEEIKVRMDAVATLARSMRRRGVRVGFLDEDQWYEKTKIAALELEQLSDRLTTDVLLLLGGTNIVKLLEERVRQWCVKHELIYVPPTPKQKQDIHRLSATSHKYGNRTPADYLGGYLYKMLHVFGKREFSWKTFLDERNVQSWITCDLERRKAKKAVGHYIYDTDMSVETFYNRYLTPEEKWKLKSTQ